MKVHIGKKIKAKLEEVGMSKAEFARRMNKSPQAIQWWFKKDTIDTGLLEQVGKVLRYNFFTIYIDENERNELVEVHDAGMRYQTDKSDISNLKKKLAECEKEKKYLQEINDLLKKKG